MKVFVNPHRSPLDFMRMIREHRNRTPLICQLEGQVCEDLCQKHMDLFGWHWNDTTRSFTDLSVDGKFGYYKRIKKYFGTDQEPMCERDGAIIGIWDPKLDNFSRTGMKPCLLSMKFMKRSEFLDLAVTFRSRDMFRRMIPNWVQLRNYLLRISLKRNKKPGILYDFSYEAFYRSDDLTLWTEQTHAASAT